MFHSPLVNNFRRFWQAGEQALAGCHRRGFTPMAVLCDEAQAYKPEVPTPRAAPGLNASAGAAGFDAPWGAHPFTSRVAPATPLGMPSGKTSALPEQAAHIAQKPQSPCHAPCRVARSQGARTMPLQTRVTPAGMVLQGKMADVCAELERLVAQENRWLRAG